MSGFSAEWLALRERYDLCARDPIVLDAVAARFQSQDAISVVDLACGAGSTVRALSSRLPARQRWDLVDNDRRLLTLACSGKFSGDVRLNAIPLDLSGHFEATLDGTKNLITISAVLDLVSENWLDRFTQHVAARALPLYAALTYDGRIDLHPADPLDAAITSSVNAHQRTDKGFGPALGPSASAAAIARFEARGYRVAHGKSDWVIGAADQDIQVELLAGWAAAASEVEALPCRDIGNWLVRRKDAVRERVSTMRVGHVDFFATPSITR
ncbi:SAM-dependent methyltransferase [Bradyrhizobium cenepequi]|uniref:SAM-dependent methyltransferase n=1 Tax=Bradyrhizobium cenepequi TaxID=2821403 RepID=UPI001CE2DAA8|nr:SAM-dependent methyltransferase [Bradyrhizobium cenepequi]MCA6112875.1 SAM-dependent methyltransferase [Bradyrhizobium cenepequi]